MENTSTSTASNHDANNKTTKQGTPPKRKALIIFVCSIILALGTIAVVQYINRGSLITKHQQEIEQIKEENRVEMQTRLLNNSKTQLTLMMNALVWAVRSSLIRKNEDEIAQYFYELVKEEAIKEVILVNLEGNIQLSTNKKNELKKFKIIYPDANLGVNKATFIESTNSFQLIAPILSLDQKIGTLFLEIERQSLGQGVREN